MPAERALRPEGFPGMDGETGLCALEGDEVSEATISLSHHNSLPAFSSFN